MARDAGGQLDAAFAIGQALGRHMVEQRLKGRMLVVTSLHAQSPRNLPHYSAAKAGQAMLVKELARALGRTASASTPSVPGAIPAAASRRLPA